MANRISHEEYVSLLSRINEAMPTLNEGDMQTATEHVQGFSEGDCKECRAEMEASELNPAEYAFLKLCPQFDHSEDSHDQKLDPREILQIILASKAIHQRIQCDLPSPVIQMVEIPEGGLLARNDPCPACGKPRSEQGHMIDEDDTSILLADGTHKTNFCGARCTLQFLRTLKTDDVKWATAEEHDSQRNWGSTCDSLSFTEHADAAVSEMDPNQKFFFMTGFYGSPVDSGALFHSLDCAIKYFSGWADMWEKYTSQQ